MPVNDRHRQVLFFIALFFFDPEVAVPAKKAFHHLRVSRLAVGISAFVAALHAGELVVRLIGLPRRLDRCEAPLSEPEQFSGIHQHIPFCKNWPSISNHLPPDALTSGSQPLASRKSAAYAS